MTNITETETELLTHQREKHTKDQASWRSRLLHGQTWWSKHTISFELFLLLVVFELTAIYLYRCGLVLPFEYDSAVSSIGQGHLDSVVAVGSHKVALEAHIM